MGKKLNANNRVKRRRPRREPRRNVKLAPREHWKFKNSHVNKKALARKANKLAGQKKNRKR